MPAISVAVRAVATAAGADDDDWQQDVGSDMSDNDQQQMAGDTYEDDRTHADEGDDDIDADDDPEAGGGNDGGGRRCYFWNECRSYAEGGTGGQAWAYCPRCYADKRRPCQTPGCGRFCHLQAEGGQFHTHCGICRRARNPRR